MMSGYYLAFGLYVFVGLMFLVAFLRQGPVKTRYQAAAIIGTALLWPLALGVAFAVATHAALQEHREEQKQ